MSAKSLKSLLEEFEKELNQKIAQDAHKKRACDECKGEFESGQLKYAYDDSGAYKMLCASCLRSLEIAKKLASACVPKSYMRFSLENLDRSQFATKDLPELILEKLLCGDIKTLYIWGGCGTGKTHLCVALFKRLIEHAYDSQKSLARISARFVDPAIIHSHITDFSDKFDGVDWCIEYLIRMPSLLVLDDYLNSALELVRVVMHEGLLARLNDSDKITLITSNFSPYDAKRVDARISSRLALGLIVKREAEDYRAILAKRRSGLTSQID